ncbi:hypothetical protein Ga0100230_001865 [Opitutaceae bacterium TAV3]|nr:hypothetical protein Ga0100230_019775 [Opitutaceae bacterium TAV3]RRK01986.1 hypothetical protein Ga0100230_001865 [Opitutaceae bacterium TAV3]
MSPPPPPLPRDQLRRLYFIDSLFAPLTGHDLYLARQIQEAIAFSLTELETRTREHPEFAARYDAEFNAAAARLLQRFFNDQRPGHGFFHWDALGTTTSATPLFARAELMTGLKRLAPYRESTLLVTNLRPAFLPPQARATPRRQRDYTEALRYVQDLAARRIHHEANLQLLFL